ncbi:peptidase A1 domain-containing protein [Haematococcus lacustris]|uniref:Peptidase A1 domain-containing protein n=1 Tax=Haematococcus lacustris TaxID=44745 RepID=A0A699YKJ3_HAELA|nr:peptidase A1 domain-containing protein [Haematococcus lacustris]
MLQVAACLQYNDICWKGAPHDITDLDSVFPRVELVMAGMTAGTDSVLVLKPLQYLFVLGTGSYCLGVFDNGNAGTLLGGITVRNVLVQVG